MTSLVFRKKHALAGSKEICAKRVTWVEPMKLQWIERLTHQPTSTVVSGLAGLIFAVGLVDYQSGHEISWSIVYVIPIALATWYLGVAWAALLSAVSVALWIGGDIAAGAQFSTFLVPVWNALIRLAFFGSVIAMLSYIKDFSSNLEAKVAARTKELELLERELVESGERERRRVSSDLHDGLGQHLTGTSLAAQMLKRQLQKRDAPETGQADELIALIEDGIKISHELAQGLQPVEIHSGGLMQALEEFATSASKRFKVSCSFRCDAPILVADTGVAEQFYRITQEATNNAVKHGMSANIKITLEQDSDGMRLRVEDDGSGFTPSLVKEQGIGLRIMAQRAKLIGAQFDVNSYPGRGTIVTCYMPQNPASDGAHA
jgi:signal transduction histidine kinase